MTKKITISGLTLKRIIFNLEMFPNSFSKYLRVHFGLSLMSKIVRKASFAICRFAFQENCDAQEGRATLKVEMFLVVFFNFDLSQLLFERRAKVRADLVFVAQKSSYVYICKISVIPSKSF